MNAKRAKQIRKALVPGREETGMSRGRFMRMLRQHTTETVRVKFEGSNRTLLEPMSTKRRDRLDTKHDMNKAKHLGVLTNWLLEELFGPIEIIQPRIVNEKNTPRAQYNYFKRLHNGNVASRRIAGSTAGTDRPQRTQPA